MLQFQDAKPVTVDDIKAFADAGVPGRIKNPPREFAYRPARVLMQISPACLRVVDLARCATAGGLGAHGRRRQPAKPC